MAPFGDAGPDLGATLEHERFKPAFEQVRGSSQANRTCPNNHDGQ